MAEYNFNANGKSYNLQSNTDYSDQEINDLFVKFDKGESLPDDVVIRPTINNRKPIIPQRLAPPLSGGSFSFADEIVGGVRGLLDPNLTPAQGMLLEAEGLDVARQLRPVESIGTEIAGYIASPLTRSVGRLERGKGTIGKILSRGREGGIYGFGAGKPVLNDDGTLNFKETAKSKGITTARDFALSTGFSIITVPLGNAIANTTVKNKSFAKRFGKKRAEKELRGIIDEAGGDINKFFETAIKKSNKGFTLADSEALGTDKMMIIAAKILGEGKNSREISRFFKNRNNTLNSRIKDELEIAFPNGQGKMFTTLQKLINQRGIKADTFYKRANEKVLNIKDDIAWQDIISTSDFQQAFNDAHKLAGLYKVKLPKVTIKNGKIITNKGEEVTEISSEFLHYVKMGMSDAIDKGKKGGETSFGNSELKARTQNINTFLDWFDSKNPAYKKARDEFAGDSEILRALQDGGNYNKFAVDELDYIFKKLSSSEKTAFRQGVYNNLEDIVEKSNSGVEGMGGNTALQLIKSEKQRKMLEIILGEPEANKLIKNLTDIVKMKNTANTILQGSKTTEKTKAIKGLDEAAKGYDNLSGTQLAKELFSSRNVKSREDLFNEGYADEVYKYISATSPEELLKIKSDIKRTGIDKVIDNITKLLITSGQITAKATLTSPVSVGQEKPRSFLQGFTE